MNLNLPKSVPLFPGNQFTDPYKENFHKTQQFNIVNGIQTEKTNFISETVDPEILNSMRVKTPVNLTYGQRKQPENDYIPRIQPAWLKYDRQVLRFSGYFQEAVVESPNENYRLRKCLIYYYLNDDTIYVTEPRQENSGIPQGVFVKRQRVPKQLNSNEFISWSDFNLGTNLNIFQRIFRVTDCDVFTQKFFAEMGVQLNDPEQIPTDSFDYQKAHKDAKIQPADNKEYKEYFEVKLGGGRPNGGLQKYLQNDRKVLSFYVYWDDTSLEGQLNLYTLNFFLADDTIEVKEVKVQNSGKDAYPLLLKRGKLPKKPIMTHYPGMSLKKEQYYGVEDLICGKTINIFNRECIIYDCDGFTRQFYSENLGIQQEKIQLNNENKKQVARQIPPYNGYGTEEDSLGSVFSLQPKPPKKDINKMFTSDQYILRFEAEQISGDRDNNDRKFLISFYCGDDTIMVYQNSERNSGIWGGKFLERMKHKNPQNGVYYQQEDFQIGKILTLGGYQFRILRADEFTHKYYQERAQLFPEANIDYVILKLKKMSDYYQSYDEFLVDLLKHLKKSNRDVLEFHDLIVGFKSLGYDLTIQEQYTIMRYFDFNGEFKLQLRQFFEVLAGRA